MLSVNPYLVFDGRCREAFDFYRSVFGGEFADVSPFSEMPPDAMPGGVPAEDADRLMHISLPLGDGQVLMGSDRPSSMGGADFGDAVSISVGLEDADEGRRIFEALAESGKVTMPYSPQFWGAHFGSCADRFGINWMVNAAPQG